MRGCLILLMLGSVAVADEPPPHAVRARTAFAPRPFAGWAVLELRGGIQGVASDSNPMLCLEVGVWRYLAVEACGSGAGFLYPRDVSEMVHFRVEGTVPVYDRGRIQLAVQPGLGFAELENGEDAPGFLFGRARSADQREGAGPEASASLKARVWPHERMYVTTEVTGGAAWIPSAPVVVGQGGVVVPFVTATVGLGF